ncbi:MAG TPA: hypothetical protein VGQ61_14575 [Candidatus Angelobacter sp.]|jgi:hypothetical protein|nr:hypothetical protein [Candidatus Angelobacter sp.]
MKRSGDPVIARDRVIGGAADSDQDVMVEHTIDHCHPERAGAHAGAPNTRVFRVVGWSHATANRRTPAMSVPKHAASGSPYEILKDLLPRLTTALQTLFAAIREIFDESAYERFLLRTNAGRSIASYRDFTHERDSAMLKKPRCC